MRSRSGTGECHAAIVVLEGLGKHLGIALGARFERGVNRERLAPLAMALASQPNDKLRAAARALWTELYGEQPTTIVDAPPSPVLR